jgi:hypothetical protein
MAAMTKDAEMDSRREEITHGEGAEVSAIISMPIYTSLML